MSIPERKMPIAKQSSMHDLSEEDAGVLRYVII
jgi:hypothetical protein